MNSQNSFKTFNPIKNTYNKNSYYPDTLSELDQKIALAADAVGTLSNKPYKEISALLLDIRSQLNYFKDSICNVYLSETGLNESRFEAEFERTLFQLTHFAEFIESDQWQRVSTFKEKFQDKTFIKKKLPIGPIMVMGASNFPLAYSTIGGDSVAALAARCPIILKAHPYHVGTSLEVFKAISTAIKKCNFPLGTFSHIIDDGFNHAAYLAKHKALKGIGFTGSLSGGTAIFEHVSSRVVPIPVFAEMGSLNPVFILDSYDTQNNIDLAKSIAFSVCNDRGQFCTKPGVIFVPNTTFGRELCDELKNKICTHDSGAMLHPKIQANFELKISSIKANKMTAELHEGHKKETHHVSNSVLIIDQNEFIKLNILKEEIFGPFTTIVFYNELKELHDNIAAMPGQLTCSIFGNPNLQNPLFQLAMDKAGRVILNNVPTGVTVCKSMQHGGPYPASSDSRFTAVGSDSIYRFLRDVTIQENII